MGSMARGRGYIRIRCELILERSAPQTLVWMNVSSQRVPAFYRPNGQRLSSMDNNCRLWTTIGVGERQLVLVNDNWRWWMTIGVGERQLALVNDKWRWWTTNGVGERQNALVNDKMRWGTTKCVGQGIWCFFGAALGEGGHIPSQWVI